MYTHTGTIKRWLRRAVLALLVALLPLSAACSSESTEAGRTKSKQVVASIDSTKDFRQMLAGVGSRLVVVDFYADWCAPCRQLAPMLEDIARKHQAKADFYKVNIDRNQELARSYRITGIPHVAFFRNKATVHKIIGLQHKDAYVQVINLFAESL